MNRDSSTGKPGSVLSIEAAHTPLFHDSLAGQKTLFLSLHCCQESPQLRLKGEATTHPNVKIMLHYTELSLERCETDPTQTFSAGL